jgi:hypothetical protein
MQAHGRKAWCAIQKWNGGTSDMKRLGLVLTLAAAIGQGSWGADKERAWQQGMLLNPENNAYFKSVDKTEGLGATGFHATGTTDPDAKHDISVQDNYVVDAGDAAYLVQRIRLSSSSAAKVFITMQVKFFVEKKKLYMVDKDGKEVETKIVKQASKGSLATGQ